MAIGPNTFGPLAWVVGPHSHMVIEIVCEMVWDKILARRPEVYWIPELKLLP